MGRGKHKDRGHKAKRARWAAKHPRGEKHGGQKTRFKRNVKQYSIKKRLLELSPAGHR